MLTLGCVCIRTSSQSCSHGCSLCRPYFCDCVLRPFSIFLPLKFALPLCVSRREERCRQVGPVWLKYDPNAAFQKKKLESVLREGAAVWRHSRDVMSNGVYYLVSFFLLYFVIFHARRLQCWGFTHVHTCQRHIILSQSATFLWQLL